MKRKLAMLLAIAMIGLTACEKENTSVETTAAEIITATETTVETEAITTTEATSTTTAEAVTTTISEAETTVEEVNYNTAYVETAEKLFYALEDVIITDNAKMHYIKMYDDDMNNDGVTELLCCKSTGMGYTYLNIIDVHADTMFTISLDRTNKGVFKYTDNTNVAHFLVRSTFWASADHGYINFYDITYVDNQLKVEIPLRLEIDPWYDNGGLICDIKGYTDYAVDVDTLRYNTDNATELGVICQTEDLDWGTESIYGEDIEAVTKLIDEYVVKDMQLEYELELVAEVERLENGEYEKAWEEIAPAIQELYPVEGNNVVADTEAVNAVVTQTMDLPAFITEKHDLTYRVVDDVRYNTMVYSVSNDTQTYMLVSEFAFYSAIPEVTWYMYDMDANIIFERCATTAYPDMICIVEENDATAIIVEHVSRQTEIYKYNIMENEVSEIFYGTVDPHEVINGLLYSEKNTDEVSHYVNEAKDEVTYYVTVDGEERILYKVACADSVCNVDYSLSELPFAEVTEVYNAYTADD